MTAPRPNRSAPYDLPLRMAGEREFAQAIDWLARALDAAGGESDRHDAVRALVEVATMAEQRGELEHAIHALELATAAVDWADLFCRLGRLHATRGRRTEARRAFERALSINPRYRAAVVERALLDAGEGRIAEAMETLRVLASESTLAEPGAFQRGLEQLRDAEFEDAGELLRRALQDGDAWLDAQLREYQERVHRGEMDAALLTLRRAIDERPRYPDLHLLLGVHELQLGATDDALESLARALELHPDYHAARIEFARALEVRGDSTQAIRQLEHVFARDPGHAEARALHERLVSRRRTPRPSVVPASDRS